MSCQGVPELTFLPNDAREAEGLSDPGVETYLNRPYAGCARETAQNARDAHASLPVRVRYRTFSVPSATFPAYSALRRTVNLCRRAARTPKEIEFLDAALNVIRRDSLDILEIADYNTSGLGPPDRHDSRFHALIKGTGISKQTSSDAGGSFGIGKNAAFAVSDLRTVFYSTCYHDQATGDLKFAAQGKSKLRSHVDDDGNHYRATGYWGLPDYTAITDLDRLPTWMRRSVPGTSIYCIGFRPQSSWINRMTDALIVNFVCAIHDGALVFEIVDGSRNQRICLSRAEIMARLPWPVPRAHSTQHHSDLALASALYHALTHPETESHQVSLSEYGTFTLRILVEADLPRQVAFLRNGMFVCDQLQHFGGRYRWPRHSQDFMAIVEPSPEDASATQLFRDLENPAHDSFSVERVANSDRRESMRTAMTDLRSRVREAVVEQAQMAPPVEAAGVDELAPFFPDYSGDGRTLGQEGGDGQWVPAPPAPKPVRHPHRALVRAFRNRIPDTNRDVGSERELLLTPAVSGRLQIEVFTPGMQTALPLPVKAVTPGTVAAGTIHVTATQGQRLALRVTFVTPYLGPVQIAVLEVA